MNTLIAVLTLFIADSSLCAELVSDISIAEANRIFANLSVTNQIPFTCSQTALVWSREVNRQGYHGGMTFIFFDHKSLSGLYPGRGWWYHVAPYLVVNGKTVVLDKDYEKEPVKLEEWVSHHHGSSDCSLVSSTQEDYALSRLSEKCHVRLMNEKVWKPIQIKLYDEGKEWFTENWYTDSLIAACKEAFAPQRMRHSLWSKKHCKAFLGID